MRRSITTGLTALMLALMAAPALAQAPAGYLTAETMPDAASLLPAPPPAEPGALPAATPARELPPIEAQEYELIRRALLETNGGIRRAAAKLGISHQALLRRLQKWPELRPAGAKEAE